MAKYSPRLFNYNYENRNQSSSAVTAVERIDTVWVQIAGTCTYVRGCTFALHNYQKNR